MSLQSLILWDARESGFVPYLRTCLVAKLAMVAISNLGFFWGSWRIYAPIQIWLHWKRGENNGDNRGGRNC